MVGAEGWLERRRGGRSTLIITLLGPARPILNLVFALARAGSW